MSRSALTALGSVLLYVTSFKSDAYAIQDNDIESTSILYQDGQLRAAVLFALVPVIVAFSFIIFIFYRAKRELTIKKKEAEFKLSIAELELKALRAQINPHFIFNCLNSIHHYIQQHHMKEAGDYLIKFSQLVRYVLETSSYKMVPLLDDLSALRTYMELEQVRMRGAFDFNINTNSIGRIGDIYIPPMMLQPFVENSIWHGLSNKEKDGKIEINAQLKGDTIEFTLEDNGIRKKTNNADLGGFVKKTSLGISIIQDRLSAVRQIYKKDAHYSTEDCMNDMPPKEGTRVRIELPFED